MRIRGAALAAAAVAALLACGGNGDGPAAVESGGGGGGGGRAGTVTVGSGIQFTSVHNGTMNPAVDTVAVGDTVTWTWTGPLPHSVRSVGTPSFASSGTLTGRGTYSVVFTAPGTYRYDCVVHGAAMTGAVVVIGAGTQSAAETVTDPVGDMFGSGPITWDLTALTAARDSDAVTVGLELSRDIVSPLGGDTTAMVGFVDLDVDQDATTGGDGVVNEFRLDGGSSGLGVDYVLQLRHFDTDSTFVVTSWDGAVVGHVKPEFDGRRVTVRIPRAMLGDDDGFLNAAAIVGNVGHPTDFVPNAGHLTLGGGSAETAVARGAAAARRPSVVRAWPAS